MAEPIHYLTQEKIEEFKKELELLRTTRRREVAENLEYAKKLGDLSENAEYHEAREKQAEVEDRIIYIEQILKTAKVVADNHSGKVTIGTTVKVKKESDNDVRVYKIVGSEEADMLQGKISNMSPIGSALMGKSAGEKFSVKTPKGEAKYVLVSIE